MVKANFLDFKELAKVFHPIYFTTIFFLYGGSLFLTSERFRFLLKTQNVHLNPWEGWKLFNIGLFFNYVLPGGVGGDLVKAYYLKKEQGQLATTSPYTVIFDRLIGLFCMCLIALCSLFFNFQKIEGNPQLMTTLFLVVLVFAGIGLFTLAAFKKEARLILEGFVPAKWQRVHAIFKSLIHSFEFYSQDLPRVGIGILCTLAAQTLAILAIYVTSLAAGAEIPFAAFFFVVPIGLAISAIPIAPPGGIGVGQAAFFFLFNVFLGYSSSIGPTVITINQVSLMIWGLQGLIFYLTRKKPLD